jgi:hypothetical protein
MEEERPLNLAYQLIIVRPRHGGRDPKTTTQGVSDTDKDIKEEVEKIRDT